MTNAIVEVEITSENIANVEMKVYEPSSKTNKAATIELRKLPGSEYEHVEKLKDILRDAFKKKRVNFGTLVLSPKFN